jgi:hypothetical protein
MVNHELWRSVMPPEDRKKVICLHCFEQRLGRPITIDELLPCGMTNEMLMGIFLWIRMGKPELNFPDEFLRLY